MQFKYEYDNGQNNHDCSASAVFHSNTRSDNIVLRKLEVKSSEKLLVQITSALTEGHA